MITTTYQKKLQVLLLCFFFVIDFIILLNCFYVHILLKCIVAAYETQLNKNKMGAYHVMMEKKIQIHDDESTKIRAV